MATYSHDFSTDTAGAAPSGWTERWESADQTWEVQTDSAALGGKRLRHTATSGAGFNVRRLLSWDTIDSDANRADTEILARVRAERSSNYQNRVYARASGAAGSETGYFAGLHASDGLVLFRYDGGADAELGTFDFPWEVDTWYWILLRVNGSAIKAKIWHDEDFEPANWQIEATDSAVTAAGWVGIGSHYYWGDRDFDYVAVGTDGDAAPRVSNTGPVRVTQAAVEFLWKESPPLRVTQMAVEVISQTETLDPGLYYYQQVLEVVVKKSPQMHYYQQVLEVVRKRPQSAVSSGNRRTGTTMT